MFIFWVVVGTLLAPRLTLGCVLLHFGHDVLATFVIMWWFLALVTDFLTSD